MKKILLSSLLCAALIMPVSASANAAQDTSAHIATVVSTSERIMNTEVIEYSERVTEDADITKGTSYVSTEGEDGKIEHIAVERVLSDGTVEVEYTTALTPPQDEVIVKGTAPVIKGIDNKVLDAEEELKKQQELAKQAEEAAKRPNMTSGENVSSVANGTMTTPAQNRAYAQTVVFGEEFACMDTLVMRESGWRTDATNASSGAYGVPQSLPGTKMATIASDWQTNGETQVKWMMKYVSERYGTFCSAKNHSDLNGWY